MKKMRQVSILAILSLSMAMFSNVLMAEENNQTNDFNKFSFGFHGGALTGFTDIKENNFFPDSDEITYGGGIFFNYHWSPVLTLQTNFLYGELKGIDTNRDWEFETELFEATINARLSLNSLLRPHGTTNEKVNFYASLGAGALAYRSQWFEGGNLENFYGYEADGFTSDDPEIELSIPIGLGINFKISERFDLGIESGFRFTSSNRLDGRPIIGSRRDMFNYTRVGITFRLGPNTNSMDWAPPSQVMYPGDVARMDEMDRRLDTLSEDVVDLRQARDQDMQDVMVRLDSMSEETAEVMQRTMQLFGAIEDVSQEFYRLQEDMEKLKEAPDHFYAVQVMALMEEMPVEEARKYLGITQEVRVYRINGWYKYISGQYNNLEDAILHMQRIWGQGVRDAFVVEYRDGILSPR